MYPVEIFKDIKNYLYYDMSSGRLHKLKYRNGIVTYDPSKSYTSKRLIRVGKDRYTVSHVIWYLVTGETEFFISHLDGDASNNRFENLVPTSYLRDERENLLANISKGYNGSWQARIIIDGKIHHLGYFGSAGEAEKAYEGARKLFRPSAPIDRPSANP